MSKLQKVSRFFRFAFQCSFFLLPLIYVFLWLNVQSIYNHQLSGLIVPDSLRILHPFSSMNIFCGILLGLVPLAIHMLILYFLIKLFKEYEKGQIFAIANVQYIHKIGWLVLWNQVFDIIIYQPLLSFILTMANPVGSRVINVTFGSNNFYAIFGGAMIILISWIMAEASRLTEEQQYIV